MKRLTEFIDESLNMVTESFQCSLLSEMAKNWKKNRSGLYSSIQSFTVLMDQVCGKRLRLDKITDDMGQYFQPGTSLQKTVTDIVDGSIPGFVVAYKDGKPYALTAHWGICVFFDTNEKVNVGAAMFVKKPTMSTTARFISQFPCKVFMFDDKYHSEILINASDPDSPISRSKAKEGVVDASSEYYCNKIREANRNRYESEITSLRVMKLKPELAKMQEKIKKVNVRAMEAVQNMSDEDIVENQYKIDSIMDALTSGYSYFNGKITVYCGLNTLYKKFLQDFAGAADKNGAKGMSLEYYGNTVTDFQELNRLIDNIYNKLLKL